ncbi:MULTISPECIES: gamma-glutamyltransferase [unclassified Diaminobutyricimonas]|uniref:gamma-glutamyltransferase family protein n=1 Tax=unclassified Diaminobutyricimonas TaxID=2643261 RepID=UPI0018DFBE1E|nr:MULTISPECIES: gamma-glutamyltransferase [unclassified Diaminobutyricimonas]
MASSSHWLSSSLAMRMLELGGNAFDAAVAGVFALQVIEPHQSGPGGDMVALFARGNDEQPTVLCGQGVAPAGATPEAFDALGLDLIPGSGLLPATVPGATPALLMMLRDYGTLPLRTVLEPTIALARGGYPLGEKASITIAALAEVFNAHWPTSYATYLPAGRVPAPGERFTNRALADTYERLVREAEAGSAGREAQLDAALKAWSSGFIAQTIDQFSGREQRDANGMEHRGLLTGEDMQAWSPTYEAALSVTSGEHTVFKAGAWSQGPVLLQQLALLEGVDFNPRDEESIHFVIEAAKLAFADREAWYGDSTDVPLGTLLSPGYADERRALICDAASHEFRPGSPNGRSPRMPDVHHFDTRNYENPAFAEPNFTHPAPTPGATAGDTVHLDVVDRWGNMVSAMPSGGWLHSSPIIPELGFALGTRMQMMWLEQGLPGSLVPGRRPRTTLSPTLAFRDGRPALAFGSPGGDQQDQWQFAFLATVLRGEANAQRAIEQPKFHTRHFPGSFYPRREVLGEVSIEESVGPGVIAALEKRGHKVTASPAGSIGKVFMVARDEGGFLTAAADPRGGLGYAVGR